jgi:hypothetical protein
MFLTRALFFHFYSPKVEPGRTSAVVVCSATATWLYINYLSPEDHLGNLYCMFPCFTVVFLYDGTLLGIASVAPVIYSFVRAIFFSKFGNSPQLLGVPWPVELRLGFGVQFFNSVALRKAYLTFEHSNNLLEAANNLLKRTNELAMTNKRQAQQEVMDAK